MALVVEGLAAGYGDTQVLWDLDMQIEPNEIVALIGSNGAGKSTLLGAIGGIVRKRGGRVTVNGDDITNASPDAIVRAGVAVVPQGRRLFHSLTVRENLLMGAYVRSDREIDADLERVLDMLPRLRERFSFLAGRLSGGEQQQVAIARALMARPKMMLIDEMSLGLSPVLVDTLLEILTTINASGVGLLLVEQDVQTALEFAGRAYVLETGRITLSGSSPELLGNPEVKRAYLGL